MLFAHLKRILRLDRLRLRGPNGAQFEFTFAADEDGAGSLTTGKLNAVRAAFKTGVKPSAIARQFGISQSDVRKALAEGTRREA